MSRLCIPFEALSPEVDEEPLQATIADPRTLAETLAVAKCSAIAQRFPEAIVIGADQVACCEGEVFGKSNTPEAAAAQLAQLSGKLHQLITAVAVRKQAKTWLHTDVTSLWMRSLSDQEIARYLAVDQPYACAGSYKLERLGISLFERIESEDHTAIVGLPLLALAKLLRQAGLPLP